MIEESYIEIEYLKPIRDTLKFLNFKIKIPNTLIDVIFKEYLNYPSVKDEKFMLEYNMNTNMILVKLNYYWLESIILHKINNMPKKMCMNMHATMGINGKFKPQSGLGNSYEFYMHYKINERVHYFVNQDYPTQCIYYYNGSTFNGHVIPIIFDYYLETIEENTKENTEENTEENIEDNIRYTEIWNVFDYETFQDDYCDFMEKYSTGKVTHINGDIDPVDDILENQYAYFITPKKSHMLYPNFGFEISIDYGLTIVVFAIMIGYEKL
jgi:hypothetical protein